jgi:hypothetical protein
MLIFSGETFHTQSVYFPHGHPTGEYIFFVDMITQRGVADEWRIEMTEFGTEIFTEYWFWSFATRIPIQLRNVSLMPIAVRITCVFLIAA